MFWKRKNAKSNDGASTGGKAKASLFSELKEYKKEKEEKKRREKEEKAYAVTHSERYLEFQENYRAWQEWSSGGEEAYYHSLPLSGDSDYDSEARHKTEVKRSQVRRGMISAFDRLSDEEKAAARKEMAKEMPRKRLKHGEPGRSSVIGAPFIFWYELTDGMDGWMKFFISSAIIIVLLFSIAFTLSMCHSLGISSCSDSTASSTSVSKSYKSNSEDLVDGDVDDDEDEDDEEEELTEEEKAAKKKEEKKLKKKLKNLDKKLPFVGMPVGYISSTYLGGYTKYRDIYVSFSDEEGEKLGRKGRSYKARIYYWCVGSNKDRDLFRATVSYDDYLSDHNSRFVYMYGKVTRVEKLLTATNYWPTGSKLPDLENGNFGLNKAALKEQEEERAEKEKEAKKSKSSSKSVSTDTVPDPSDYGSATAYADSEQYWFRDHGYANPYDAAYDYFKSYGDDRDFEEL